MGAVGYTLPLLSASRGRIEVTRLCVLWLQDKLLTAESKVAEMTKQLEELRMEKASCRLLIAASALKQNLAVLMAHRLSLTAMSQNISSKCSDGVMANYAAAGPVITRLAALDRSGWRTRQRRRMSCWSAVQRCSSGRAAAEPRPWCSQR